jgi:hypothetical protein
MSKDQINLEDQKSNRFSLNNTWQYVVNYAKNCRFLYLKMYSM